MIHPKIVKEGHSYWEIITDFNILNRLITNILDLQTIPGKLSIIRRS